MNRIQLLNVIERYFIAGFHIEPQFLRLLQEKKVIIPERVSNFLKFWDSRIHTYEVKVYLEGRNDMRSSYARKDDLVELVSRFTRKRKLVSEEQVEEAEIISDSAV